MIPGPPLDGARAIVVGLGLFGGGLGAARWLLAQGARVLVTDLRTEGELAAPASALRAAGAELALGGHGGVAFDEADLLVVNPAVRPDAPPLRAARAAGVPIETEMGLVLARWPGPRIGITGSNGKSTTTALTHALLEAADVPSVAGGNLGGSLLDRLDEADERTVAVLELSSFMLEMLAGRQARLDVAVLTNITPNHLERHGSLEAYRNAKREIFAGAGRAVLYADDPQVALAAEGFEGDVARYGAAPDADLTVDAAGTLAARDGSLVARADEGRLAGRMNRLNLAAAVLATEALLRDVSRVRSAVGPVLSAPPALPHRLAPVADRDGVRWIDDSASTTPESTAASLQAVGGRAVLIAGGRDKGLDAAALVGAAERFARVVLAIGEEAAPLAERLRAAGVVAEPAGTLDRAVARAAELAEPGDTVLLSPGYSSQDQFLHFDERGTRFVSLVDAHCGPCRKP